MIPRATGSLSALSVGPAATPRAAPGEQVGSSFASRLQAGAAPSVAVTGRDIVRAAIQDARSASGTSAQLQHELQQSEMSNLMLLNIQVQLTFSRTSLKSNLLKVRHDTAKNSIQNVR